ncbi:MAG: hypothetical protein Q7W44_04190 [Coriobacteriia bacterium]|nr:hypothetical protein [Coriobacteriia bacterium]
MTSTIAWLPGSTIKPVVVGGYRLPNPLDNQADYDRVRGRDIGALSDSALVVERVGVEHLLVALRHHAAHGRRFPIPVCDARGFIDAVTWAIERLKTVNAEIGRRRRR